MLGPFADQRAVDALNHEMGTDRPLVVQYADWVSKLVQGDMGNSYAYRAPVAGFVGTALLHSAKLALVAFLLVVPLSLLGGVIAALHVGRPVDRIITTVGMSATIVPEFVSGIAFIPDLRLVAPLACRSRRVGRRTPASRRSSNIC